MTREEAIKYLNEFIFFKKISNTTEGEVVECFKLAVEALQEHQHYKDLAESYEKTINKLTKVIAEPQPNEDCISRKAVLESLHSCFTEGFNEDRWWNSTHVLDTINEVPSIQPQPKEEPQQKTGHWIWCASSHKCSNCGGYVCFSHKKLLKYCPECGAKMQEEKK